MPKKQKEKYKKKLINKNKTIESTKKINSR